jgi:hypothetical protein
MDGKNLDSNNDQIQTIGKKKSWDYFSILLVIGAGIYLFYNTRLKDGFHNALLFVAIIVVFSLSFRIPATILRGLKNGMNKERTELILVSIFLTIGLIIIIIYGKDWRFIFIFPIASIIYHSILLLARQFGRYIKSKF